MATNLSLLLHLHINRLSCHTDIGWILLVFEFAIPPLDKKVRASFQVNFASVIRLHASNRQLSRGGNDFDTCSHAYFNATDRPLS